MCTVYIINVISANISHLVDELANISSATNMCCASYKKKQQQQPFPPVTPHHLHLTPRVWVDAITCQCSSFPRGCNIPKKTATVYVIHVININGPGENVIYLTSIIFNHVLCKL